MRNTECEDRSLDNVREQRLTEATSEEIKPSSLQLQRGALNALYHIVICPIADMLQCKEIVFVPNGPLCLAPFFPRRWTRIKIICASRSESE